MEIIDTIFNFLYQQAPWLISVMVVARVIFKPLISFIDKFVEATPSDKDNVTWENIKGSPYYKTVAWVIDFLLSIKLPKPKAELPK